MGTIVAISVMILIVFIIAMCGILLLPMAVEAIFELQDMIKERYKKDLID